MTGTEVEKRNLVHHMNRIKGKNLSLFRAPPVQWAERRHLLYLFVHVPDSLKPEIQLNKDKLYFKTKSKSGTEYEVTLNFYKDLDVESSKYCLSDRGVDFVLKKAEEGPYWNQLLKENKKCHWLKIDFTRWRDEDDSDAEMNEDDFENMMKRMSGLQSTSKDLGDLDTETDDDDA